MKQDYYKRNIDCRYSSGPLPNYPCNECIHLKDGRRTMVCFQGDTP